jgi:aryl-alcohol dehydrogenase-like predicted oxidoreductase
MKQLGLGLIGIGRRWGHVPGKVPSFHDAVALLEYAYGLGIRYFDTAPSYGTSEERLGCFLKSLTPAERRELTVATKFGEHWNAETGEPFVDHSFEALRRSLDASLARLGSIDILQLHKTTPDTLRSDGLARAWEYAASAGAAARGASVGDLESAAIAVESGCYSVVQLPFNRANPMFGGAIEAAAARGMLVVVNRPFAMGKLLHGPAPADKRRAFEFILKRGFRGVILSGTKNRQHLHENLVAFHAAIESLRDGGTDENPGQVQPSRSL